MSRNGPPSPNGVSSMHRFRKSTFPLPPFLPLSLPFTSYKRNSCQAILGYGVLREHRYIFPAFLAPVRSPWSALRRGNRGGLADPSAFSVNLFGIPEILEALPSAISPARLHNIVFISSCNARRRAATNPFQPTALHPSYEGDFVQPSRYARIASYTRARNGLYIAGLQGEEEIHQPLLFFFFSFLLPSNRVPPPHHASLLARVQGNDLMPRAV